MEEDLRQAEEENIQRAIEEKNRREAEDYDKATNPPEVDPLAPNTSYPYKPNYVGPDTGEARPAFAPWDYALGAYVAKPALGLGIKKYGAEKVLEVGMNALFPDVPDALLEQGLRAKQMGLAATTVKGARIAYDTILKDVFDDPARRIVDWGKRTTGDAQYLFGGGVGTGTGVGGKALRSQKSKFSKGMVYDSTIELGGSTVDAKRIWEYQQKRHTDIKKTVSLLNEIYQIYEPNTRISIRNGKLSFIPRTRIGSNLADRSPLYKKSWQFDKDHIRAVINQFGPMEGADMAENLEIIFGSLNRKKSNVFELPAEILDELGVPKNIDEFVFKQLHPEYAQFQNKIPNRWKESFTKNILNDYYEKLYGSAIYKPGMEPIVSKKKWPAIMKRLVRKYKRVYSDKNLLKQLEEMESIPFWKRIKPNEIPRWAQTLDMPPSPKDPFWLNMPPKSQQRWKTMVKDKYRLRDSPLPHERGLRVEGSKEKYYK